MKQKTICTITDLTPDIPQLFKFDGISLHRFQKYQTIPLCLSRLFSKATDIEETYSDIPLMLLYFTKISVGCFLKWPDYPKRFEIHLIGIVWVIRIKSRVQYNGNTQKSRGILIIIASFSLENTHTLYIYIDR